MKTSAVAKSAVKSVGGIWTVIVALLFAGGVFYLCQSGKQLTPQFYAFAVLLLTLAVGHGGQRVVKAAEARARDYALLVVGQESAKAKAAFAEHVKLELSKLDTRCRRDGYGRIEHS